MPQFLGIDASTQSISGIVIDTDAGSIVLDESINFGSDLPQYNAPTGVLDNPDPLVKHSNPLMWVEALEQLFGRCRSNGFDWSAIRGIGGSGQQHGTVYLNTSLADTAAWSPSVSLADQVRPMLSRATSPIWMDSSTSAECDEIAAAAGGNDIVVQTTGSIAIERFSGPQIRRFWKTAPAAYEMTARIHLVSSFMASLLSGVDAPIDPGDGAGMNLLNLTSSEWDSAMLEATAPGLADRLPPVRSSSAQVGEMKPYFCDKYGFNSGTPVIAWSGDNPNSLVGMGAVSPGVAVISLGTSDTFFAAMGRPTTDPNGYGHVFGNPAGGFMSLICFKNGSLTRDEVRNRFSLSWDNFSDAILTGTAPGNNGNLMLPYFESEITPRILNPSVRLFGEPAFMEWQDANAAARAVVEAQALTMRLHSEWIDERPRHILVTGGASRNPGIRQVIADVFGAELQCLNVANSAALGAALRAAHAGNDIEWEALFDVFAAPDRDIAVRPNPDAAAVYDGMTPIFRDKVAALQE